ncbi:MAG: GNAT family N-acetyltransferase [Provencibacterium sp.]|jgi:ribosomal-protein-alanine N-acetyltransferase|nr:GNAT family N-acetyltransferase [Provencibacterium sp.]
MEKKKIIAETERLILRRYLPEDLEDLFAYLSDPEVVAFEPYLPMSLQEARENLEWRIQTEEMIAVELKSSRQMIGNVYLGKREFDSLELGFVFHRSCWGKGYAQESCLCLTRQAFDNGIHRIFAECDPLNSRSWRLLERLGFTREAHLRQNVFFRKDSEGNPIWKDTYIYARLHP